MQLVNTEDVRNADQLSELIGAVYDGAMEQPPWGAMLTKLRTALRANWTALILRPPMNGALAQIINAGPGGIGFAPEHLRTAEAFAIDPMVNLPLGRMVTIDEFLGSRKWSELDYLRLLETPQDYRFVLGADIRTTDGVDCRLRICRGQEQSDFDAADKAFGDLLLPHLQRAVEMHLRLTANESENRLYNSAVDRMLVGAIVFDMEGRVLRVNEVANAILHERDGLDFVHGRLRAHYTEEDRKLQVLLRQALADARAGSAATEHTLAITRPTGSARLSLVVRNSPMNEWSQAQRQSAVLVMLRDPGMRSEVSTQALRHSYGLTEAEAHLCIQLIEGLTLDEAAERLGIRKNTARAHLRAIFSKTHVTRQSALVSLLMAGTRNF